MYDYQWAKYLQVPSEKITEEGIKKMINVSPKRVHFATTHAGALRLKEKKGRGIGYFSLPFTKTVQPIFNKLGFELCKSDSNDSCYTYIKNYTQYDYIKSTMEKFNNVVFIRDLLDLSIALSMNFDNNNCHTEIGELEYQAKFKRCNASLLSIINEVKRVISALYYYREADCICAMPPSRPNDFSLPTEIVRGLAGLDMEDISTKLVWTSKKESLKDASIEKKLDILKESGLTIDSTLDLKDKVVLLIDDLYMSGTTMQFVAMKLKEAGALRVLGLSIVKSRSNK